MNIDSSAHETYHSEHNQHSFLQHDFQAPGRKGAAQEEHSSSGTYDSERDRKLFMANHDGASNDHRANELAENRSPGMLDDDSQVCEWVRHHTASQLRIQATQIKIQMIHTLLSGWISDRDVTTIGVICRSVIEGTQAAAIRTALRYDLTRMSSIHQRTRVRLFFAQMPRNMNS